MQGIKTPPEKADAIKSLIRQGNSCKNIAQTVGVSIGLVRKISASMKTGEVEPRSDMWVPAFKVRWEDMRRLFGK